MVAYGLGFLPIIKNLKAEYPDITHPWYDENVGALGTFRKIEDYFNYIAQAGPDYGNLPETRRIVLITHMNNTEAVLSGMQLPNWSGRLCGNWLKNKHR